jgi:ADP-ribose pyrophosphatase
VFLDTVCEPDGFSVPDYLVVAPKRRLASGITGIAILPIVDGAIALVRQYRHAVSCLAWEIPRGFIEDHDDQLAAAARELHEETGLACDAADMLDLGFVMPDAGILDARIQLCAARACRIERAFRKTELGLCEMHLVPACRVRDMIVSSEIVDPSTIVSYYRYCARHPDFGN